MPFNLQTFKTRSLTAIVFVIVMLAGLFINFYSFLILFSINPFRLLAGISKTCWIIDPSYKKISTISQVWYYTTWLELDAVC